jgi:lanosterol synthase
MDTLRSRPSRSASALERGVDALVRMQRSDGSWESECVWCPMLTAQYVMTAHITQMEISPARRDGMLAYFRSTQNRAGLWGLNPNDGGSLFVTSLVYVAARLLGAEPSEPWLGNARQMFEHERGVQRIPTWGKVWLSLLGLYEWAGVYPILPEVWKLPSWLPIHPANYYCHTRLIYLGLAVLFGQRFTAPITPLLEALRTELYAENYAGIDFAAFAGEVREEDAAFPVRRALKTLLRLAQRYEQLRLPAARTKVLRELRERMRADLRASGYLSLSPVNGLLTILGLWAEDPNDRDLRAAIDRFDAWFWEDASEGSRVAGARSVCWDTSFALQALAVVPRSSEACSAAMRRGAAFLTSQQIERAAFDYQTAHRIDPSGGWCFSEFGHGWPVSDCTAEALLALLHSSPRSLGRERAARAVRFVLRCQNRDGGFGSYEPARTRFPLEWMNPSEMFGRCMKERSYVECTASCLMALQEVRRRYPDLLRRQIAKSIAEAREFLLESQNGEGSWEAAWGVHYVYATMFAVRGLLSAGLDPSEAPIRRACRWLLAHQRRDGGWGEMQPEPMTSGYVSAGASLSVQTAWALITLVEAREPERAALQRAACFLESNQQDSGEWPDGQFVGVFFETALLNYRLYRQYFPVMALALHERALAGEASRGRPHGSTAISNC